VTDGASSSSTAGTPVVVNPAPALDISLNRTSADVGEAVGFSCTAVNGTQPFSISWSFGDSDYSEQLNVSHAYSAPGTMVVSCTGADGAGVRVASTSSVTVTAPLTVGAADSWGAAAPGTVLKFTAQPINGSGTYTSYAWSFGDGTDASGASVTHGFLSAGTFDVKVKVVDSNGISATATVGVTVSPVATTVLSDPTSSHSGGSLTFAASAAGGAGGPYNYSWSFGDGTTGYGSPVTHAYGTTGTFLPTLTVTDRLGGQNVTHLTAVGVTAAPGPLSWLSPALLLVIAALVGLLVAVVVYARRRSDEGRDAERMSSYVPPTDPSQTLGGSKVCGYCQTPDLPVRKTCATCGKPLPRTSTR
jgi:chitodextrinase